MEDLKPAVIFDLDGTLIDSAPDIHAAVNVTLKSQGLKPLTFDQTRSFIGRGVDHLWTEIAAVRGLHPSQRTALRAGFMSRYNTATSLTRVYPGVPEALGALIDAGYPLGLCTNKPMGPTRAVLDHFGLLHLFATIIAGDSLPQRKPDPAPLRSALDATGGTGIFVGDSEIDAQTAQAAGVPFLLFTLGYRKAAIGALPHAAAFDNFMDLPALALNTFNT